MDVKFLGIDVNLADRQGILAAIDKADGANPVRIATLNPEFMLEARKNAAFRQTLREMTHCSVDGSGLYFFLKFLQRIGRLPKNLPIERYQGSTMVQELIETYQKGERAFFLLGGAPGMAATSADKLRRRYPNLSIRATDGGIVTLPITALEPELKKNLATAKPDIVFVGFGAPKQEAWINQAARELAIPVMAGIGGSIEFYSSRKRAPRPMQVLHIEWLHRTFTVKNHWKRTLRAVVVFPVWALFYSLTHRH